MILTFIDIVEASFSEPKKIKRAGKWWTPNKPKRAPAGSKKKFQVLASKRIGGETKYKLISYGHRDYQDFRQHKNKNRRKNYLKRSSGIRNGKGELTMNDKFSPNYHARRHLW